MRQGKASRPSAVVLAYHNVGVRCLKVLLAHDIDVRLVVTHRDDPGENIWFGSVAQIAADYGLPTLAPQDVNVAAVTSRIAGLAPDFLFSFYYRQMVKPALLAVPERGALNMHGSLLPKYRGRAPVNWAVLHGERETGATLHYMTEKPDNGDIVAQCAVPILPDDTAQEVFDKVTVAAEIALDGAMPALIAGTAPRIPQDLKRGGYFGGRKPADGIIDWSKDAATIHNLVRAVAPPYPGAMTSVGGVPARILRTHVLAQPSEPTLAPTLESTGDRLIARCGGGGALQVSWLELDGVTTDATAFRARFGSSPVLLGDRAPYTVPLPV
ncbi:MAG TPA: formyltransferase [Casimicrobiaceae bacterium]|nr:formyltransferase [Casimicrobiaceae bacterium]